MKTDRRIVRFFIAAALLMTAATNKALGQSVAFSLHPAMPPFLRPGDRMELPLTIRNRSRQERTGQAELQLTDAATRISVDGWFQNVFPSQYFTAPAADSTRLRFPVEVPYTFFKTAHWRFFARAGQDTAVATGNLPVLPHRPTITHTTLYSGSGAFPLPTAVAGGLQPAGVLVQVAAAPAAFAYAALPVLLQAAPATLTATADKLFAAAVLLQWMRREPVAAKGIIGTIGSAPADLDTTFLRQQATAAVAMLQQAQTKVGAFPLWAGGSEDQLATRQVLLTTGRLQQLNAVPATLAPQLQAATSKAMRYLQKTKLPLTQAELAYLQSLNSGMGESQKKALGVSSALGTAPPELQAMMATVQARSGNAATAARVLQLATGATSPGSMAPAIFLEAAHATGNKELADSLTRTLLQQKGISGWGTAEATTAAAYALLLGQKETLPALPAAAVQLGRLPQKAWEKEHYFAAFAADAAQAQTAVGQLTIKQTMPGAMLALVHRQFVAEPQEDSTTALLLERTVHLLKGKKKEPLLDGAFINRGDTVEVVLHLKSTTAQDYLQLTDAWPAGFELLPDMTVNKTKKNVLVTESLGEKKWLIQTLPSGNTPFTYRMRAVHAGTFSSGAAILQRIMDKDPLTWLQGQRLNVE